MLPNHPEGDAYLVGGQAGVVGEFYDGFHPEFRLAVRAVNVNVHSRLFAREEVETEPAFPEYGGTHGQILRPRGPAGYLRCVLGRRAPVANLDSV